MRRRFRKITFALLLAAMLWVGFQTMGMAHHHSASEEQALSFCSLCQAVQNQGATAEPVPQDVPAFGSIEGRLSFAETPAHPAADLDLHPARGPPLA